jgi:hypothetical protein
MPEPERSEGRVVFHCSVPTTQKAFTNEKPQNFARVIIRRLEIARTVPVLLFFMSLGIRTFSSTCTRNSSFVSKIRILVNTQHTDFTYTTYRSAVRSVSIRRVQRVQELIHHSELLRLFRETIRRFQILLPKKRKPQTLCKDQQVRAWNAQRVRVRSNVLYNSRSVACGGFNTNLTFAHQLELKQNYDGSEALNVVHTDRADVWSARVRMLSETAVEM